MAKQTQKENEILLDRYYVLQKKIGEGGQADVWQAEERYHKGAVPPMAPGDPPRQVVIRLLKPDQFIDPYVRQFRQLHLPQEVFQAALNEITALFEKDVRENFKLVQQLNHPNLCPTYRMGCDHRAGPMVVIQSTFLATNIVCQTRAFPYNVLKYLSGECLDQIAQSRPSRQLTAREIYDLLGPIAAALDYMHTLSFKLDGKTQCGLLHHDVKPNNIIVDETGPVLLDFGLLTPFNRMRGGTIFFSPLEQLIGHFQNGKTDQYSLAATAYQLATGRHRCGLSHDEFRRLAAEDHRAIFAMAAIDLPEDHPKDDLPDHAHRALLRALSSTRRDRFASCSDFIEAFIGNRDAEPDATETLAFDLPSLSPTREISSEHGAVWQGRFSPDGEHIVLVASQSPLWGKLRSASFLPRFRGQVEQRFRSAAFSPNGKHLYLGHCGNQVVVWDVEDSKLIRTFSGMKSYPLTLAVSHGGNILAAGDDTGTISLWSTAISWKSFFSKASSRPRRVIVTPGSSIYSLQFSSCDRYLLAGCGDRRTVLYDLVEDKIVQEFIGHDNGVRTAVFSPDESQILTGSDDSTVRLWDKNSGQQLKIFEFDGGQITSLAYFPDGKRFLFSCDEGAYIWSVETGKPVLRLDAHADRVEFVEVSADGKTILTAGGLDETAKIWPFEP